MKCAAERLGELRDFSGSLKPASHWRATITNGHVERVQTVLVTAEVELTLKQVHGLSNDEARGFIMENVCRVSREHLASGGSELEDLTLSVPVLSSQLEALKAQAGPA